LSLLVIDDDPRFPEYLRTRLRGARTPFDVDVARTVREGVRQLARGKYEVCLLDYCLGTEDGLDVLQQAKARGLRTPIVLLTGEGSESLEGISATSTITSARTRR
jgi:DNA-binding response OmpR family regulator